MSFKTGDFFLILPVALAWLAFIPAPVPPVLASLAVLGAAESLRQYLNSRESFQVLRPKRLFLFGQVSDSAPGSFLNPELHGENIPGLPISRKMALGAGLYAMSFTLRFIPQLAALDFFSFSFFSLMVALWAQARTYRALNRLLLLQFFVTGLFFATAEKTSLAGFFLWLAVSLFTQLYLHLKNLEEEARFSANSPFSLRPWVQVVSAMIVIAACFQAADFAVPVYRDDDQNLSFNPRFEQRARRPRLPPALARAAARLKLNAGGLDLSKLKDMDLKDVKDLNLGGLKGSGMDLSGGFGENRRELQELRDAFAKKGNLTEADLEKFSSLARKIHLPAAGGASGKAMDENPQAGAEVREIENELQKFKSLEDEKLTSDSAEEMQLARQKLASEIDKLTVVDRQNTLAREETHLQDQFSGLLDGGRRFAALIIFVLIAAWLLGRKKKILPVAEEPPGELRLPKELRVRLKSLYKRLLAAKLSAQDEVLQSFYIVELAFKEINFARAENLPPLNFQEKVSLAFPFVAKAVQVPIGLFNRVFYGNKIPDEAQIKELRASMKELMQKLQVI